MLTSSDYNSTGQQVAPKQAFEGHSYQNWLTRGRMVMALSQMLRAWFTWRFFISISAYFSHSVMFRCSTSSARS